LLERALALGLAEPLELAHAQGLLGMTLNQTGRLLEGDRFRRLAVEGASRAGDEEFALRVLVTDMLGRGSSDPAVGSREMKAVARRAIEFYSRLGEHAGLAAAEHLLGVGLGMEGLQAEREAALERALEHADASGEIELRRRVIGSLCRTLAERGPTPVE